MVLMLLLIHFLLLPHSPKVIIVHICVGCAQGYEGKLLGSFCNRVVIAVRVKNLPANAGETGDAHLSPGLGRSPFQLSCLENSMNRGAWQATIHGVAKRQT